MSVHNIRVLLAEDHAIVRDGLRALLEARGGFEVIDAVGDGAAAVERAEAIGPDVVLMDVGLPGLNGVDATRRLQRSRPDIRVLILSMHDDPDSVDRALRAGARGYALKGLGGDTLCEALRTVARGEVYLSPGISEYVLQGYLRGDDRPNADPLTEREREILQLIAEGYTSREIAQRLGLKPKTVQNHRANIMEKLQLNSTAGLVRYAIHCGLTTVRAE
jgi:two-component system response regulator NreC